MNKGKTISVLFVCLGNICRSPTAHGVFQKKVNAAGLSKKISVDSAGTGEWHIGKPPDERAQAAAAELGYDLSPLRARQFTEDDLYKFDYILAMDNDNLFDIMAFKPKPPHGHIGLFLGFAQQTGHQEVPDPFYGDNKGFEQVLKLVENASDGLLQHIRSTLK